MKDIRQQVDVEYQDWWNNQVLLNLTKIQVKILSSNESRDFILDSVSRQMNRVIAEGIKPSKYHFWSDFSKKRELNLQSEGAIKKIKFIVPSTKLASTFEPIDKIFEVVLIPDDTSTGDQVSHTLGKILTPEDESFRDWL